MSIDHRYKKNKKNDDENIPESVVNFLNYLNTIKESSNETISGYRKDLSMFFRYMLIYKGKSKYKIEDIDKVNISKIDKKFIQNLKLADLYAFMNYLQTKDRPNGASARARKVATLKSYFKYLHSKEKIISNNIAVDLESPKQGKREAISFTDEQVEKIFNALDESDKFYYRNKCIVTLLLKTGMRVSELRNIKLNDIMNDKLLITGKGDKQRVIHLNSKCLESIKDYIDNRITDSVKDADKEFLFLSNVNKQISKQGIENMMKQLYSKAGLTEKKYVTHTTRHTVGTNIYKNTKDILMVAEVLGHENMNTSRIYITMDDNDIKNVMNKL